MNPTKPLINLPPESVHACLGHNPALTARLCAYPHCKANFRPKRKIGGFIGPAAALPIMK